MGGTQWSNDCLLLLSSALLSNQIYHSLIPNILVMEAKLN